MDAKKKEAIMASTTFEELLDAEYGKQGTAGREKFEAEAEAFCLAECLKEHRLQAGLTQEELANKIGTKKSYISKIENGLMTPSVGTFYRIINALGLQIIISKPAILA